MSTRTRHVSLCDRIYRTVARIPEGTVATYGQIAEMVGTGPRQVGRALAGLQPGTDCPWHRVINARGMVSIRCGNHKAHLDQERLMAQEGIAFRNGKVDLEVYRWDAEV